MKSERRHDLETNELALQVKDWIENVKPYQSQIVWAIVGVIALLAVWSLWGSTSSANEEKAWDAFTLANYSSDPELSAMKQIAENEEYAGTPVPEWAYLAWCDRQLLLASQTYLVDRFVTTTRLKQVQNIYQTLASGASSPQIQDRARFGLAQVLEMLGKIDEARAEYAQVNGDLSPLASARSEQLETDEVKEACAWLASAELPKREPLSPPGTAAGTRPSFDAEVPATTPNSGTPADTRTLEEILTGATGGSTDENRYGEQDATESADTAPVGEATEDAADGEATDDDADETAEAPATDAAGQ